MIRKYLLVSLFVAVSAFGAENPDKDGWFSLFDGKTLDGWKASDAPGTFSVEDGKIVVHGPRSHLFYVGPIHDHDFTNFKLRADVMTFLHANSGIYFHTEFQPQDWPSKGFEVQVNNTHQDTKRTAGLYDVKDYFEAPAKDEVWFNMEIEVVGKHVVTKVDGKTIVDWTQPDDFHAPSGHPGRVISHGTFALQGHDPGSKTYFKNIEVKPLP